MPHMPIEEVKPGMVLEDPAVDTLGRVLLESGEELTEKYLTKLKAFGLETLSIKPEAPPSATGDGLPKMSRERQKEILKTLQTKFAHCVNEYAMKTLYEVVLPYLTGEKE